MNPHETYVGPVDLDTPPDVILELAAGVLEERGWTRGQWEDEEGRVCASAAINVVTLGHAAYVWPGNARNDLRSRVRSALVDVVNDGVIHWNDKRCSSQAVAITTLRRAAAHHRGEDT